MNVTFNKKEFKHFLNIFLFENRKKDKRADFFSISDQYMWRRDENKLIAFRFEQEAKRNYNYSIEQVSEVRRVENLAIYEDGRLELEERKEIKKIYPDAIIPLEPHSLALLGEEKWDAVFQIPSEFLTKQLSLIQSRIAHGEQNMEALDVTINLEDFAFSIGEEPEKQMPLALLQKDMSGSVRYAFLDFKDILMNAIQFDKMIEFKVKNPYFTRVKLTDNIFAILTHKKENSFS